MISSDKIAPSLAILSKLPNGYEAAIKDRANNIVGAEDADVIIIDNESLKSLKEQIIDVYQRGDIVVVIEPKTNEVNAWMKSINLPCRIPENGEEYSIYAFSMNNGYLHGHITAGDLVKEYLNPFVRWLNSTQSELLVGDDGKEDQIKAIADCQQFTEAKSFEPNEVFQIAQAASSDPDVVKGNGSLSAHYTIYPIYVFPNSGDEGEDFYYVEAEYMAENVGMTNTTKPDHLDGNNWWPSRHMWISKHGGSYNRICALYMKELIGSSELVRSINGSYSKIDDVIFAKTPQPETSQNEQEKTVSLSFDIGADAGLGGSREWEVDSIGHITNLKKGRNGSFSVSGKFSYSNSNSMNVKDVVVGNNQTVNTVNYKYTVQNLPEYEFHFHDISISEPPTISINGANFVSQWIWKVPGMKVDSDEKLYMHTTLDVEYGSFHYLASGTYYTDTHKPANLPFNFYRELKAPNRTRTGLLRINNKNEGLCIEQIKIYRENETKPYRYMAAQDGSIGFGDSFNYYLPVGSYRITFEMGETHDTAKHYELSTGTIKISFCSTTELSSAFNFRATEK